MQDLANITPANINMTCKTTAGGLRTAWTNIGHNIHLVSSKNRLWTRCVSSLWKRLIRRSWSKVGVRATHFLALLTLPCAIVRIRTIGRGLQKNCQRTFAWVLGSLWWLDQEREQHGCHFAPVWSIVVKFSIFYWPQRHANSNDGDGRLRSFSFGHIFGDFSW